MTTNGSSQPDEGFLLSEALLERCRERAPGYDSENRFFFEDFDEVLFLQTSTEFVQY